MTLSCNYTRELELLILDTLLPVYVESRKAQGFENPHDGINPRLLEQIKSVKPIAALLRPKEKPTRHI